MRAPAGEVYGGERERRKNRLSGAVIVVVDTADPQNVFDPEGGRWVTACDTHHTICNHATLALARFHAAVPDWCEECQAVMP